MRTKVHSIGLGIGTKNSSGEWLEIWYPRPTLNPPARALESIAELIGYAGGNVSLDISPRDLSKWPDALTEGGSSIESEPYIQALAQDAKRLSQSQRPLALVISETDEAPASVPEAYLKLHLLSTRQVKPRGVCLDGIFACLPNVVWTNRGAIDLLKVDEVRYQMRCAGEPLTVFSVDKLPHMLDYVVPKGVRIGDGARVRLGAYLGEGTTVMQEGFVNFNAGTVGPGMIEGRISAGVFVNAGSDLGGGCSIMGTLSGGNSAIISVGERCLIGANAGIGISLGDECIIEAGLYLTAGSQVNVLHAKSEAEKQVKAATLSGQSGLLFRRNSISGAIECMPNGAAIELNTALHAHN